MRLRLTSHAPEWRMSENQLKNRIVVPACERRESTIMGNFENLEKN